MSLHPAKFYQNITPKTVKCGLCHHACEIANKKTGLCGVRKNIEGKLYSLVYSKPVALNVDPIEKKPLFHFQPGSSTYSIGTLGCNFFCGNCQNYHMSQGRLMEKRCEETDETGLERIIENALGDGCTSISYTYNEPTVFIEYAFDLMKLAQQNGLKNVWVSNGFMSTAALDSLLPYLDAINIDLKSMDDDFYRQNCGARLQPVLDNLKRIKNEQVHLEITTLLIPSLSDDLDMLKRLAEFMVVELDTDTPWHISRFSPDISWKLRHLPPTRDDMVYEAHEIGKEAGLKYVYVGNIPGDQKENTYCPSCGELCIRRLGYHIERLDHQGLCPSCERSLDIVE